MHVLAILFSWGGNRRRGVTLTMAYIADSVIGLYTRIQRKTEKQMVITFRIRHSQVKCRPPILATFVCVSESYCPSPFTAFLQYWTTFSGVNY